MNQEALKILLSFILLTIIFIIIVLIILENYSSFKEKIKTNKLDKRYKKELIVRKKNILDTRYRSYKFVNNNINVTLDASNHNNPYETYCKASRPPASKQSESLRCQPSIFHSGQA